MEDESSEVKRQEKRLKILTTDEIESIYNSSKLAARDGDIK